MVIRPLLLCAVFIFNLTSSSLYSKSTVDIDRVTARIAKIFDIAKLSKEGLAVKTLTAGQSDAGVYKVTSNKKSFVVRLLDPNASHETLQTEINNTLISSTLSVSAKVHFASLEHKVIVMDFIESADLSLKDMKHSKKLVDLGNMLARLHNGPKFNQVVDAFKMIQTQVTKFSHHDVPLPENVNNLSKCVGSITPLVRKVVDLAPSHNDLHLFNLMADDKRFWIIDWESGGNGIPHFDLAMVSNHLALTKEQENALLKGYSKTLPSSKNNAIFYLMKQVSLLYSGLDYLKHLHFGKHGQAKVATVNKDVDHKSFDNIAKLQHALASNVIALDSRDRLEHAAHLFLTTLRANISDPEFIKSIVEISSSYDEIHNVVKTCYAQNTSKA